MENMESGNGNGNGNGNSEKVVRRTYNYRYVIPRVYNRREGEYPTPL